jgi:uncharacterized protein HemY
LWLAEVVAVIVAVVVVVAVVYLLSMCHILFSISGTLYFNRRRKETKPNLSWFMQ